MYKGKAVPHLLLVFIIFLVVKCDETEGSESGNKDIVYKDGIHISHESIGKGETIVLLHGGPGLEYAYLLPEMEVLAKQYRLIFYDHRFIGGSKGAVDTSKIKLEYFVNDLEFLRKKLKIGKFHLLGHSFGGLLAIYYTIKHQTNVKSLMLLNSAGASSDFLWDLENNVVQRWAPEDKRIILTLMKSENFKNSDPETVSRFFKIFFKSYFYNQSLADRLNIKISKNTAKNWKMVNSSMWKNLGKYDLHEQLLSITCPTIIIHADFDPIPVEFAKKIHQHIVNSEMVVLKKYGHFPHIETPEELFKILENFLNTYSKPAVPG